MQRAQLLQVQFFRSLRVIAIPVLLKIHHSRMLLAVVRLAHRRRNSEWTDAQNIQRLGRQPAKPSAAQSGKKFLINATSFPERNFRSEEGCWRTGVMEYWSTGVLDLTITALFHHSITPTGFKR